MKNLTTWVIDPLHSDVIFKIKHLVISTVTGSFRKFEGRAVTEGEGFTNAKVSFTIDVKSIDTNQAQRDLHLQDGDFFSADLYPQITFKSTSFVNTSGSYFKMVGDLTLKGVTKQIELDVEYGGSQRSAQGVVKHGFEVTGTINRKEFGMTWNVLTDTGNLGLGEDIKLVANIQVSELVEALKENA
jgi:polyisoprenoid-binding protein YceI